MTKTNILQAVLLSANMLFLSFCAEPFFTTQVNAQQQEPQPVAKVDSSKFSLRVDAGAVWQKYNDLAIPGDEGTRFDLAELEGGAFPFYRIEGNYDFAENQRLRILYAPLTLQLEGEFEKEVKYNGKTFRAGEKTKGSYRFNSYRMSWAYKVSEGTKHKWHLGFTGKVRDAETSLEQDSVKSNYTNVGFVPLAHIAFEYRINDQMRLLCDLDAAAAPQGRAEDLGVLWRRASSFRGRSRQRESLFFCLVELRFSFCCLRQLMFYVSFFTPCLSLKDQADEN